MFYTFGNGCVIYKEFLIAIELNIFEQTFTVQLILSAREISASDNSSHNEFYSVFKSHSLCFAWKLVAYARYQI